MIIDFLVEPCAECLGAFQAELQAVPSEALLVGRSVFCPHRGVALTVAISRGRPTWWQIWPTQSPDTAKHYLASVEAAMIEQAAAHAAQCVRH